MTHKDIYTKFMIEYDKADITSSYPSLTEYEVATLLDKSYLALIAQKLTGNNVRQVGFEGDNKAIEDVRPLINTAGIQKSAQQSSTNASNEVDFEIPEDLLYYVNSNVDLQNKVNSIDDKNHNSANVELVTHNVAQNFMNTSTNMPWILHPVLYVEKDKFHVLYDSFANNQPTSLLLTYITKPNKFALENDSVDFEDTSIFQLSDTMAEELINLAIIFATKVVENPRFTTEVESRPLES